MYFCRRNVLSSSFLWSSENTALLKIPLRDFGLTSADHILTFAPSEIKLEKLSWDTEALISYKYTTSYKLFLIYFESISNKKSDKSLENHVVF